MLTDAPVGWKFRLRRDARVQPASAQSAPYVTTATSTLVVSTKSPVQLAAVTALDSHSWTELDLVSTIIARCGEGAVFALQMFLHKLRVGGWLEHELYSTDATLLAVLRPLGDCAGPVSPGTEPPAFPTRLSRFALARAQDGALQVETPRDAVAVIAVDARAAAMVTALVRPVESDELPTLVDGLDEASARALVALLHGANLLTDADPAKDPELVEQRFAQWSQPDLLMHSASRAGRREGAYGGSYRFAGRFPPEPGVPPRRVGTVLELPVPDLTAIAAADPPLTTVLERRRSLRSHDDASPITAAQLGELLYRSVRCRGVLPTGRDEAVDRPYPAGGSLHELEIYPVVTRCDGVDPGLWHYATADHALEHVSEPGPALRGIVGESMAASMLTSEPQVLLVISARFGRVMWKYEAVPYALVLKHVGVLYQTLYLVATAMGLAACGLGGGNADRFAQASGLDYYLEGSVGEFLIGSNGGGRDGVPR